MAETSRFTLFQKEPLLRHLKAGALSLCSFGGILRDIEENGYEIAGAIRENYIDGVWNQEESGRLTEIQVSVRNRAESL